MTIDPSVTGREPQGSASADLVYTISEFCHRHHVSVAFYYKQRKLGLGPREMVLGRRRLISAEAAAEWRRERERDR